MFKFSLRDAYFYFNPLCLLLVAMLAVTGFWPTVVVLADDDVTPVGEAVSLEAGEAEIQFTGCDVRYFETVNADFEQRVVELVNEERRKRNLPPLKRNRDLDYAARYHARDMAEDGYFAHDSYDSYDDGSVKVCGWSTRVGKFYSNWNRLAENIAAGYLTPESVVDGWMNSKGHRANILSSDNCEIGVGYWSGGYYNHYWVQDFGRRNSDYPLVINLEYAQTASPDVQLYIYGQGMWSEMRLRNDDGAWTAWQPFQSSLNWRLNHIKGIRTVTVELRNESQTSLSSDTIELTTSAPQLDVQPAVLTFFYETNSGKVIPPSAAFSILNIGSDTSLSWTVENNTGNWFSRLPAAGSTPGSLVITPDSNPYLFVQNEVLRGALTIRSSSGDNPVAGSPKQVAVQLLVVEQVRQVYLPVVRR